MTLARESHPQSSNGVRMWVCQITRSIFSSLLSRAKLFPIVFSILLTTVARGQDFESNAIYLSFQERVMISYLLLAAGEVPQKQDEIINRATSYAIAMKNQGLALVKVASFEEYLNIHRGEWPNAHSVEANLEIIENSPARGFTIVTSDNLEVQNQIDRHRASRIAIVKSKMGKIVPYLKSYQSVIMDQTPGVVAGVNSRDLLVAKQLKEKVKKNIQELFQQYSADFIQGEFRKISSLGKELLARKNPEMSKEKSKVGAFDEFIVYTLSRYFSLLKLKYQKQIISQLLGENLLAGPLEKFKVMVMNSGPPFIKMLQLMAREDSIPKDIGQIFKILESATMKVPEYFARPIIERDSHNFSFQEVNYDKPLGTGAVAQVHSGKLRKPEGIVDSAVRILKPEVQSRSEEDHRIFAIIAPELDQRFADSGLPKLGPLVERAMRMVEEEMFQETTAVRQKLGREFYVRTAFIPSLNRYLVFQVPRIIEPRVGNSKLLVQELVKGEKLDDLQARHQLTLLDLKKELTEKIAELWLSVLLFEKGFYHSDLHQGNMLVDLQPGAIVLNILDFGMAGQLDEISRKAIILIAAGSQLNNEKMLAQALYQLSKAERNKIDQESFVKAVAEKVQELRKIKKILSADRWLTWASDYQGLYFNDDVLGVGRGLTYIDSLLVDAQAKKSLADIGWELVKKRKTELMGMLLESKSLRASDFVAMGIQAVKGAPPLDESSFEKVRPLAPMCRTVLLSK